MREDLKQRLIAINAECRFRTEGPTFEENAYGKMVQKSNGGVHCDIFDATVQLTIVGTVGIPNRTALPYATACAGDETLALEKALAIAEKAEKPLTPAQKADRVKFEAREAEHAEQLKDLREQLEAANAKIAELSAATIAKPPAKAEDLVIKPPEKPAETPDPTVAEKEKLRAALKEKGIKFPEEMGLAKLKKLAADSGITV